MQVNLQFPSLILIMQILDSAYVLEIIKVQKTADSRKRAGHSSQLTKHVNAEEHLVNNKWTEAVKRPAKMKPPSIRKKTTEKSTVRVVKSRARIFVSRF